MNAHIYATVGHEPLGQGPFDGLLFGDIYETSEQACSY